MHRVVVRMHGKHFLTQFPAGGKSQHTVYRAMHEEKLQLAFAAFLQNLSLHFKLHFGVLIFIFPLAFKAGTESPDKNTA